MSRWLQFLEGAKSHVGEIYFISSEEGIPVPYVLDYAAGYLSKALGSESFPLIIPNVDVGEIWFCRALIAIAASPLIWNCLGRLEYHTRFLSTIFLTPTIGTCVVACWIFFFGLYRDALFLIAIERQAVVESWDAPEYVVSAALLALFGGILVLTSFYQLGLYGTFLGDYFGILMDEKVTAFPFNIMEHPMYDGSTMLFLAKALEYVFFLCANWARIISTFCGELCIFFLKSNGAWNVLIFFCLLGVLYGWHGGKQSEECSWRCYVHVGVRCI